VVHQFADVEVALDVALIGAGIVTVPKSHPKLDNTTHRDPTVHGKAVVFVANPTAQLIPADVGMGAPVSKVGEIWEGKPVVVAEAARKDDFAPYTIKTCIAEA
jgi:hypothetical protein